MAARQRIATIPDVTDWTGVPAATLSRVYPADATTAVATRLRSAILPDPSGPRPAAVAMARHLSSPPTAVHQRTVELRALGARVPAERNSAGFTSGSRAPRHEMPATRLVIRTSRGCGHASRR